MANDREVLREIWEGRIPISFQADKDEVISYEEVSNFYLMAKRVSYFPLVVDKVSES